MKAVLGLVVGIGWLAGTALAQTPAPKVSGDGLKAEYFAGPNFERKVLTRTDPSVNFNWNWQSPGPGVPREYFSVRWTGKLYAPTTGAYRFSALVDDGIRVWVGGRKVIDEWRKQDDTEFVGEIVLTAGKAYDLRVEYYNDWKGSVIYLFWETPEDRKARSFFSNSRPDKPIPSQYLFSSAARLPVKAAPRPARKAVAAAAPAPKPPTIAGAPAVAGRESRSPIRAAQPVVAKAVANTPAMAPPKAPDVFTSLNPGSTLVLKSVLFDQSSYRLLSGSYEELDKLVRTLAKNPDLSIRITGHTDNIGDARLNRALSENRAKVVANYLVQHGIAADRLEAAGLGGAQPVADNGTESGRAQNRRVEFTVK